MCRDCGDWTPNADELSRLLRGAEQAHGEYEKAELGGERDENRPQSYAEFIVRALDEGDGSQVPAGGVISPARWVRMGVVSLTERES